MTEKNAGVLWAGRLEEKPERSAFSFQSSIGFDKRMALEDVRGSRAHAAMLGKQGVIAAEDAAALDEALGKIAQGLQTGEVTVDEGAEDVHSFVEGLLTEALGDAGRSVHAGRSRNDQVATDFRLYCKRVGDAVRAALKDTINVLLDRAGEHAETLMAGFTHLQRAQPVTLGHQLTAWAAALSRDAGRFSDALARMDECPLGSGALAGTTLPLDREAVARDLGFARPALNAMDAVADRDFALELAAACAVTQTHLSRFCEDVCLWASEEWAFVDLGEKWSTGSSIMPQKKNPDFAELVRGKTGRVNGNLIALLTVMKGLPYAYNKDLQEDKEALFDSLDTVLANLRVFSGFMGNAVFNKVKMEASCAGGFLEATDVAEYLVKKGMPFRKAHECAAHIVRDCIDKGLKRIGEAGLADLQKHSPLIEADIFAKITPRACVEARNLPGGPAPDEVRRQIAVLRDAARDI
ncbi:MAG: argininosuccinate lyase [Spirochaetaceae bacterium]|jgi:argininosuccinate lyase|nr:argininosuccinate lyase [Spirochaetaceae bacterium]